MLLASLFSGVISFATCFGLVAQGRPQKVGVCAGVSHTFGLTTFGCQETYTLLNITLQRRIGPCLATTPFTSGDDQVPGDECSTRYVNLIFRGIQIYSQCNAVCESDFAYRFQGDISQSSGCCSQGESSACLYDQIWVYYQCDLLPTTTTTTTISTTTTDDTRWVSSVTPRSTEKHSEKTTTASSDIRCNDSAHAGSELQKSEPDTRAYIIFSTIIAILSVALIALLVLYCTKGNKTKLSGSKLHTTSLGSLTTWRYVAKCRESEGFPHDVIEPPVTLGRYMSADGGIHIITLRDSASGLMPGGHVVCDVESGSKFASDRSIADSSTMQVHVNCDVRESELGNNGSSIDSATSSRHEECDLQDVVSENTSDRVSSSEGDISVSQTVDSKIQIDDRCPSPEQVEVKLSDKMPSDNDHNGTDSVPVMAVTELNGESEMNHTSVDYPECCDDDKCEIRSTTSDCDMEYICDHSIHSPKAADMCNHLVANDDGIVPDHLNNCIAAK